ncbi:MAG: 3',5'-cyclic-nucleotide phosphodiesterase, partial [uncultured Rubrobacteraceae bacterium]
VGCPRRLGAVSAGPPPGHHRGDQRPRAGPRGRGRGPDDGGLPLGVRGGQGFFRPAYVPERRLLHGQPRRQERRLPALRGVLRHQGAGRRDPRARGHRQGRLARLDQARPRRGRGRAGALPLARLGVQGLGPGAEDTHDPPPHPRRAGHGPGREQLARRGGRHGDPARAQGGHGPLRPPPRPLRLEHLRRAHRPLGDRLQHEGPRHHAALLQRRRDRRGLRQDHPARTGQGRRPAPRQLLPEPRHHQRVLPGLRALRSLRPAAVLEM